MTFAVCACSLEKIEITIDPQFISYLDKNPYYDTSFYGTFACDSVSYAQTELCYRGAYSLNSLIKSRAPQRNWKVKTPQGQQYRGFKVWNYNFEPFLCHNLAYLLLRDAGVPCVSMRQVVLYVNSARHGLYSEFPDPDNKKWLKETFGNASDNFVGDLFKAATDKPNLKQKFFADLTVLGVNDSNYYLHYIKKTNDSTDQAASDYSSLRNFIRILNETPDSQFADTIDKYFDVASFLKYLTVANYSDFWDGYPNRAKNFWLYLNPYTGKWVFIPWDLDATFDPVRANYNNMGTECDYMFMYNETNLNKYYTTLYQTSNNGKSEITPRPLFTKIMNVAKYRDLYASMYKQAMSTYLKKETVLGKIDSIASLVYEADLADSNLLKIDTSVINMKQFVENRTASLEQQLSSISVQNPLIKKVDKEPRVRLKLQGSLLSISNDYSIPVTCRLYLANGKSIAKFKLQPLSKVSVRQPARGVLMYEVRGDAGLPAVRGMIVGKGVGVLE